MKYEPETPHPKPLIPKPAPCTVNHRPSILNPAPDTLNPEPHAVNPKLSTPTAAPTDKEMDEALEYEMDDEDLVPALSCLTA